MPIVRLYIYSLYRYAQNLLNWLLSTANNVLEYLVLYTIASNARYGGSRMISSREDGIRWLSLIFNNCIIIHVIFVFINIDAKWSRAGICYNVILRRRLRTIWSSAVNRITRVNINNNVRWIVVPIWKPLRNPYDLPDVTAFVHTNIYIYKYMYIV